MVFPEVLLTQQGIFKYSPCRSRKRRRLLTSFDLSNLLFLDNTEGICTCEPRRVDLGLLSKLSSMSLKVRKTGRLQANARRRPASYLYTIKRFERLVVDVSPVLLQPLWNQRPVEITGHPRRNPFSPVFQGVDVVARHTISDILVRVRNTSTSVIVRGYNPTIARCLRPTLNYEKRKEKMGWR